MAVQEKIYRGSGDVGTGTPLPGSTPEVFGAAIGRGMEQLGSVLHRDQVRSIAQERQRQDDADMSTAMVGLAQFQQQANDYRDQAREEAPTDGGGHVDRVTGDLKGMADTFLGTVTNERVRQRIAPHVAGVVTNIHNDEDGWARGRRALAVVTNAESAANGFSSNLQNAPEPSGLQTSLDAWGTYVQSVAGGDPALTDKLERFGKNKIGVGFVRGTIEKDPAGAVALLQSGTLDGLIDDADTKHQLLNEAQTGVRMSLADANRQQSQAEAQLREDVTEFKQRVDRGELPSDDDTKALATRAQALGLTNLVDDISYSTGKLKLSRETDKWTPAEWENTINPLAAKVATGKASAEEQQTLKILQELRGSKEARFNNDPHGFAAASGSPPPEVDVLGSPKPEEISALRSWAKAYRQSAGLNYTPFLSPTQLKDAKDTVAQGAVPALELSMKLRNEFGVQDALEIARQVDPRNMDLALMVRMHPSIADRYRRGVDALKRNPKLFGADKDDEAAVQQVFAQYAPAIPQEMRTPLFEAAKNIAAGTADWTGAPELGGKQLVATFQAALQRAAGQLGRGDGSGTGGFATWHDRKLWLPNDMGGGDFARRVSRAGADQWIHAGGGEAFYQGPNGKLQPVPKEWYGRFKDAPLSTIAPGLYAPLGRDGRPLRTRDGRLWQFDVRRLP